MTVLRALTAAWLADRPHGDTDGAYARLLDVRDAVHVVTGRGRDRLGKEDHDSVAALLGLPDPDTLLTGVVTSARTIAYALDGTVRRAAPVPARPHPAGRSAPAAADTPWLRAVRARRRDRPRRLGRPRPPTPCWCCARRWSRPAQNLPLSPATIANLAGRRRCRHPGPRWPSACSATCWPPGPGLIPVWEGLDLAGVIESLDPGVGRRPQPARSATRSTGTPSTGT